MRIAMTLLSVALAVSAGACKKKEKAPDTTTTTTTTTGSAGSGTMAGSDMAGSGSAMAGSDTAGSGAMAGSDMAGSGAGSGSADTMMAKHAGNCPSTVLGSTTTDAVKGKDVIVTITSTDKDAVVAIQMRADQLIKDRSAKKGGGAGSGSGEAGGHDQRGTHGGSIGLCPVHIPEGATAKVKHEKNGVVVTITPKDKPDELKTEIDGRITKAADWVKANIKEGDKGNMGGVGGGTNKEGANHSGQGDAKGIERKKAGGGSGGGDGGGGGKGTGGGGGKGAGGGSAAKK